jgi:hypothetical protein
MMANSGSQLSGAILIAGRMHVRLIMRRLKGKLSKNLQKIQKTGSFNTWENVASLMDALQHEIISLAVGKPLCQPRQSVMPDV